MQAQASEALLNGTSRPTVGQQGGYGAAASERSTAGPVAAAVGNSVEPAGLNMEPPQEQPSENVGEEVSRPSHQPRASTEVDSGTTTVDGGQATMDSSSSGLQGDPRISAQRAAEITEPVGSAPNMGLFAAESGSGEVDGARGFFTPRSRVSQFQGATSNNGNWPGWVSRLREFFVPPVPPAWMPSPIPSPPRPPAQIARRSLDLGGADGMDDGFRGFRLRYRPPNTQTPTSSSVPAEAIQAEVQRQLGTLLDRLAAAESENARLQDALVQRESARQLAPGDPPAMEPERPVQQSSMPGAMGAAPSVPQRGSTSAGDPWTAIWEGLYGKFGARAKAGAARHPSPPPPPQVSETTVPQTAPAIGYPSHGLSSAASPGILEALTQGMQQLQDLQAKALKKDHAGDDVPEVVKTATVSLPELPAPTGEMSGLHAVAGLVGANNYLYAGFVSWVWRLVGISAGDGFRDLCGLVGSNTTGTITDQSGGSPEAFFWKVDSSECESLCLDDAVVFGVHQG